MVIQIIAIILINLVFNSFCEQCPDSYILTPCTCVEQKDKGMDLYIQEHRDDNHGIRQFYLGINCVGSENYIYLSKIFEEIDEKHECSKEFGYLNIEYTGLTEFKENTFHNSTFERSISIISCRNLETIHENAFTETSKVTKHLYISRNRKLNGQSLFKALNKFTAVQSIELWVNGITEIPSEAFSNQVHLRKLVIMEPSLMTLGQSAFKGLANLKYLKIFNSGIDIIPDFAFEIQESSKYPLYINLCGKVTSEVFAPNALANIGRTTLLNFNAGHKFNYGFDDLEYLNQTVFLPFLQVNLLNKITLYDNAVFDCTSCKNYWIKSNNLIDRLVGLKCPNGLDLDDPGNFAQCNNENDNGNKDDNNNNNDNDKDTIVNS